MYSLKRIFFNALLNFRNVDPQGYWSKVLVSGDKVFSSREDSLNYLDWRNSQYYNYEQLMPVCHHDGEVVLDYGCGPGNDIVGLVEYSRPKMVMGVDISEAAIDLARKRLCFHDQSDVMFVALKSEQEPIPAPDQYFDYIHSSGVLHHVSDLPHVLREFHRVLKDDGHVSIMIYNRDSIFYHLYVSYLQRKWSLFNKNKTDDEIFKESTDGKCCPISIAYRHWDFATICNANGFDCTFVDAAISTLEMSLLGSRFEAIEDERLPREHRLFLKDLSFNDQGLPLYRGTVAGIDAVYRLKKHGVH